MFKKRILGGKNGYESQKNQKIDLFYCYFCVVIEVLESSFLLFLVFVDSSFLICLIIFFRSLPIRFT